LFHNIATFCIFGDSCFSSDSRLVVSVDSGDVTAGMGQAIDQLGFHGIAEADGAHRWNADRLRRQRGRKADNQDGVDAAGFQFLQQGRNFRVVAHRTAGLVGQVLSEIVTVPGQNLEHDLSERAGLGHRRYRMQRPEVVGPARGLGESRPREQQCCAANHCHELTPLHFGTLLGLTPARISRHCRRWQILFDHLIGSCEQRRR